MTTLSLAEQEVHIVFDRLSDTATIYSSDITFQTYMNKRVKQNPDDFKIISANDWGVTYECPKKFISIRTKNRSVSDEQREASSERLKKYHASKGTKS